MTQNENEIIDQGHDMKIKSQRKSMTMKCKDHEGKTTKCIDHKGTITSTVVHHHLELPTSFTCISPQLRHMENDSCHVLFFCLCLQWRHNCDSNISIEIVSGRIMKITTLYTTITNCHHNLTPNVVVWELGLVFFFLLLPCVL